MKTIKLNDDSKCMSVACDFYQTCYKNSVSHTYTTKRKFTPVIQNETHCFSSTSGKRSELKDNNYPVKYDRLDEIN